MSSERPDAPSGRGVGLASAAALLALCALLLGEAFSGGRILSQADALLAFEPWRSVAPAGYRPKNPLLLDQSLVVLPWLELAGRSLRQGELPLWNPDNYLGQPLVAANTGATYWPLHALYYLAPSRAYLALSALVRLFLAGWFTRAFLRRLGVGALPALLGGVAFALSGFSIAWLGHPHTNVSLCLPLLLLQVERAARRPTRREVALVALATGAALLGGHVQTALHVGLAALAYALFRALVPLDGARLRGRGLAVLGAGALLGGLVAAPQLLPLAEYLRASQAAALFDALDTTDPVAVGDAAGFLVAPDRFGNPARGDYHGPLGRNLNYNELVGAFVGRVALGLALLQLVAGARARRASTLFFAAMVAAALLAAWQVSPLYELLRALPVLRSTKLTRLLLLAALGLAVLAALGLERAGELLGPRPRARGALGALALAAVALELVLFGRGYNPAIDPALVAPETPVTAFLRAERERRAPEPFRVLGVDNTILLPNANLFHGIALVSGYDSIEARRTVELVAELTNHRPVSFIKEIPAFDRLEALPLASLLGVAFVLADEELPAPLELVHHGPPRVYRNPLARPRAFAARSVEVIPEREQRLAFLGAPGFDPSVAVLDAAPADPLFARVAAAGAQASPGEVALRSYAARRVELEARLERPALVVLADAHDPGWSVAVDGAERPLLVVDHALRGVLVDAGRHLIEMRYDPASTRVGLALAALALLLVAFLGLWPGSARRRSAPPADAGVRTAR